MRSTTYQHSRAWFSSLALVLGLLFVPATASANMANPHQPGDPVGEPSGGLESVTIEHETLVMDLRPLADDHPAVVDATYDVRQDGPARTLRLVFIATGLIERGDGVWLDNGPVPAVPSATSALPASWQPPKTTPGIGGGVLGYSVRKNGTLTFNLHLTPGRHQIRVHYLARASSYSGDSPARYWQLGYVLAPARSWAHFGGLDVRVHLPPGWRAASSPVLKRVGDDLVGSFDSVPADTLGLTVQAPFSAYPYAGARVPLAWVIGLVGAIVLGALTGRWLGRRRRTLAWAIPLTLGVAVLWMIGVALVAGWNPSTSAVPDSQLAWTYDYGNGLVGLAASFLAFISALVITPAAAFAGRRWLGRPSGVTAKSGTSSD